MQDDMSAPTKSWLDQFNELCQQNPGPVAMSLSIGTSSAPIHILLLVAVHGNEIGTLPAVIRFVNERLQHPFEQVRYTVVLGNPEAVRKNVRFVDVDLNRVFFSSVENNIEQRRAQDLIRVIQTADLLVDFHQTVQPTREPFYIFQNVAASGDLAQILEGAGLWIHDQPFPGFQLSSEQYAQTLNIPSVAIEVGQLGINAESEALTYKCLQRLYECESQLKRPLEASLKELAQNSKPLKSAKVTEGIRFVDSNDRLFPNWKNLDEIKKGQALGTRSTGDEIVSPVDGYICFPKYLRNEQLSSNKLPMFLCEIAVPC